MEQMENVLRLYVLKEEQCHAVLGLLEQKDFVAVLPTGFGKTLIIFLFAAVNSNEEKVRGIAVHQHYEVSSMIKLKQ